MAGGVCGASAPRAVTGRSPENEFPVGADLNVAD